MAHPKEKCFKQAYSSYARAKNLAGDAPNWSARFQQVWAQSSQTGAWSRSGRGRFIEMLSQKKTQLFNQGIGGSPGSTLQFRVPDVTLFIKDVGTWILDLKFTRPGGGVDGWTDVLGKGNGMTQRHDITDMNRQLQPGKEIEDPKLDPQTCNCRQRMKAPSQVQVYVSVPFERWQQMQNYVMQPRLYILPLPAPGALGALGSLGAAEGAGGSQGILEWLLGTAGTKPLPVPP